MAYGITTAYERIKGVKSRIKVIQGGMRAGKTIAILLILLEIATKEKKLITIAGTNLPHLKRGALRDFVNIITEKRGESTFADYYQIERNRAENTFTFFNGSVIEFVALDDDKARGSARDILFINEANLVSYETFRQLYMRTEGEVWLDFNPVNEFWAHTKVLGHPEHYNAELIKLTYLDNEGLSDSIREAIEAQKGDGTSNFWRVYGLGEIGSLEGNVYSGWKPGDLPAGYKLVRYGLDFGFSNDETAMVAIYENENKELFIKELLYEKGLLGSQYVDKLKSVGVDPTVLIVADAARPEIIAEIRRGGYRIIPANKDKGSVKRGIDRVSQRSITYQGDNLEKEFLTYAWRKRKSGEVLDEPQDGNDHCFVADTIIKTPFGDKKMIDLVRQGKGWVYSEGGKIRYFRNAEYKGHRETVILEFENGAKIQCTPDHPIYTINRGIVPAYLLNAQDMIQLVMYESKNNITNQARVQRLKLLERLKGTLLQKRSAQATHSAQGSLDISQRRNTEGNGDRPYRQKYGQQPDRKSEAHDTEREQQKCSTRNYTETQREHGENNATSERMAQERGRQEMALGAWQESVSKEKADRKKLCSLWEKILYNTILKNGSLLLWKLQNESKTTTAERTTREYTTLRSRTTAGVEATYCLDVYDTSNLVVNGNIVASNCMDALRYAIDDMAKRRIEF